MIAVLLVGFLFLTALAMFAALLHAERIEPLDLSQLDGWERSREALRRVHEGDHHD